MRDAEHDSELREDTFKTDVFVANPDLYQKIFGEESNYLDDNEIEHVVPEDDKEFNKLMRELRQVGIID